MSYRGFWRSIHDKVGIGERAVRVSAVEAGGNITVAAGFSSQREQDFRNGRACAREALSTLACPELKVDRGPDREPVWPAGLVGSISHTDNYCVAVIVRKEHVASVGVDAERRISLSSRVIGKICDATETSQMLALPQAVRALYPIVLFSAKESLFKCLFQIGQFSPIGFRDATLHIDWRQGRIYVEQLRHDLMAAHHGALYGRFTISARHVLTYIVCAHREER